IAAAWPGLAGGPGEGLFTPEDWRLEPRRALAALRDGARAAGARMIGQPVAAFEPGEAVLGDGSRVAADALVLATGAEPGAFAPELARLTPIKGQILTAAAAASDDDRPALRCEGGYLSPARDGLRIGATMEAGRADRIVDVAALRPLRSMAIALAPALESAALNAHAGVRAATPDALPLVGP